MTSKIFKEHKRIPMFKWELSQLSVNIYICLICFFFSFASFPKIAVSKGFKKDYKKGGDHYHQPSYPTYPVYHPQPARYYPRAPAPHYAKPPTTYYPQPPKYGSYH